MCGNVGAVEKEKTSLHVLNVPETAFPLCRTRTKFPGADHFYRKNVSWGTIFPLKISVRGTKIFRTKIPVTGHHMTCALIGMSCMLAAYNYTSSLAL